MVVYSADSSADVKAEKWAVSMVVQMVDSSAVSMVDLSVAS